MSEQNKRIWYNEIRELLIKNGFKFGGIYCEGQLQRLYCFCSALMIEDKSTEIEEIIKKHKFETYRSYPVTTVIKVSHNKNTEEIYITITFT